MDRRAIIDILEIIGKIVTILGVIGIFITLVNYKRSKSQFQISILQKCIDSYRKIVENKREIDKCNVYDHLGLINEELFYMQHGYLPKSICREWLNNMLDYMPIILQENKNSSKVLNLEKVKYKYILANINLLDDFPKILKIFTIKKHYDFEIIYSSGGKCKSERNAERQRLIDELLSNFKKNKCNRSKCRLFLKNGNAILLKTYLYVSTYFFANSYKSCRKQNQDH